MMMMMVMIMTIMTLMMMVGVVVVFLHQGHVHSIDLVIYGYNRLEF